MKQLIVFLILLNLTAVNISFADGDDCDCEPASRGLPVDSSINFLSKLGAELSASKIRRLTIKLCSSLSIADVNDTGELVEETLEKILMKYSGITSSTPDYKKKLAYTWNKYNSKMICQPNDSKSYPKQHFFVRSVMQGHHLSALENYFFADAEKFPIDPNVVVKNQHGVNETVIDYINRVIASPEAKQGKYDITELTRIRDKIINDFNGVRANQ